MSIEPVTVPVADDGQRLDRWLKVNYAHVPYTMVQKAIRKGEVRLDGKRVKGPDRITAGQELRLPPVFHRTPEEMGDAPLSIEEKRLAKDIVVYQDKHLLVLNKPAGLPTQGGHKITRHLDRLLAAYADKEGNKPKLVHRLDKETSGLVLVARTREIAADLGRQLKNRHMRKTYLALTIDVPRTRDDVVKLPLNKVQDRMVVDKAEGKHAVTEYRTLSFREREVAVVALRPVTGRMHQLRVHMQAIHCPILGDDRYDGMTHAGAKKGLLVDAAGERLWLHAMHLHFVHPVTEKEMHISLPIPPEMDKWLDQWGLHIPMVTDTDKPLDPMDERI